MPQALPTDFTQDFEMLEGEGVKRKRINPVSTSESKEIPPLDFETVIHHLRRNGYDVDISPNGQSLDAEAEGETKHVDISCLQDDAVQVEFSIDIEEAEEIRGQEIDDPEAYVEHVYGQIFDELVEREKKLEKASQNYVSKISGYPNTIERLESDFQKHGDDAEEIIESYFGSMRPSELGLAYALQFELYPGETVENERRNLEGKMPLHDTFKDEDIEDRNRLYFQRYLEKVLEKTDEQQEISDELRDYWQDLP